MTTTGKIFKSYVEAIIAKDGFGSKKMVENWSTDFLKGIRQNVREATRNTPEEDKALEVWDECYDGQRFLLKSGYLRQYRPEYMGHRGRKPVKKQGSLYIGLTEKGWAVAQRYLDAEE